MALAQQTPDPYDNDDDDKFRPRLIHGEGKGGGTSKADLHSVPSEDDANRSLDNSELRALEGGGEGDGVPQGKLSAVGDDDSEESSSLAGVREGEEEPEGSLYNPEDNDSKNSFRSRGRSLLKRKKLVGGAVLGGGGFVGLIIAMFVSIGPLKVTSIVENVQNKFTSTSNAAVENETDNLFNGYIKNHLIPGMNKGLCNSTTGTHKDCVAAVKGSSPVSKLYSAWQQGRIEDKLASDYGIEFGKTGNKLYMKAPGLSPNGIDLSDLESGKTASIFDYPQVKTSEARQALNDALENETFFKRALLRFQFGRLMEEKYGIKRCVIACNTQDKFNDKVTSKQNAAKEYLFERVEQTRAGNLATAIQCFVDVNCNPTDTSSDGNDGNQGDATNGEHMSDTNKEMKDAMDAAAATFGQKSLDQLASVLDDVRTNHNGSFQDYLLSNIMERLGLNEAAKQWVSKALPLVGWINFAAGALGSLQHAPAKLQALSYAINAAMMVGVYMTYRTVGDETKTGHMDADELGSFANSLGPGTQPGGKGSDMTATPLYQSYIDGNSNPGNGAASMIGSLISPKAAADSTAATSTSYLCQNGKPVPSGKLICPEEDLRAGNTLKSALSSVSSVITDIKPLSVAVNIWNSTFGAAINSVSSALNPCSIPLVGPAVCGEITSLMGGVFKPLLTWVASELFASPFNPIDSDGGRTADMIIGGGDVAGNDMAHHSLGGQALTPQQTADIEASQADEASYDFQHQPLFARMFGSDSHSMLSQVANMLPDSFAAGASSSIASLISDPFGKMLHSFASMFTGNGVAFAAAPAQPDPFGITQYGYLTNDPVFSTDPETYWQQHNCDQDVASGFSSYNSNIQTNADTQQAENNTTDGCMLIQAAVGDAGAVFDENTLTPDELGDSSPGTPAGGASTSAAGLTNPFPGGWVPNRLDMGYDGTFKGQIVAPLSGTITYATTSFSNWGGWIEIKADQQPAGLPTSTLYFAEGVKPLVQNGQHVDAGTPIAAPAHSPFGDAYKTDPNGNGEIEWGVALDGPVGSPTNTYVYGKCNAAGSSAAVLSFAQWAEQNLQLAPPSQTSNAGCP